MYLGQTRCEAGTESHGSLFRDSRVTIKLGYLVLHSLSNEPFSYYIFINVMTKLVVKRGRKATGLF